MDRNHLQRLRELSDRLRLVMNNEDGKHYGDASKREEALKIADEIDKIIREAI